MVFGGKDFKVQTLVFPTVKAPKENPKREKGKKILTGDASGSPE
jgi:hypothetical protein